MKLSEQVPHRWNCEIATYTSGNCTCYVAEIAKLEAELVTAYGKLNILIQREKAREKLDYIDGYNDGSEEAQR